MRLTNVTTLIFTLNLSNTKIPTLYGKTLMPVILNTQKNAADHFLISVQVLMAEKSP